jgi:ABC-type spermidine/putrescine transport system permease subunit I
VLQQVNDYTNYPYAVGISLVLLALILILISILTVLQQRSGGLQLRFRTA